MPSSKLRYDLLDTSKKQIRLLQLERSGKADQVSCKLEAVNLDIATKIGYRALSYTWGPELPAYEILINGQVFVVRENLYQFLKTIKAQGLDNPIHIWIDQICINQDDIAERAQQVSLMTEIYEGGLEVIVWLGIEDVGDFNQSSKTILLSRTRLLLYIQLTQTIGRY
jgi:hypothetical protein